MGRDKDDDECGEEGHGHECGGHDDNGVADAKDARAREMREKDECMAMCHGDNESVEGAEHEHSRNDCATARTHGTDHDEDHTSTDNGTGSRGSDGKNGQAESLLSLNDSDRRIVLRSRNLA